AVSASDVWAVGLTQASQFGPTQTLTLHWDGTSWSVVPSQDASINDQLSAVAAVSSTDVWAVGKFISGANVETLIEHWNGTHWSIVSSPAPGMLAGLAVVSPTDIWAVGSFVDPTTGVTSTVIEQWNGTAWSVVTSPTPSASEN